MEFEKNHIDTLHYRWSYILSLISLNLQQRQDCRWWNWSCTTERGTCKESYLHSKESRRQFIHNQHRESHSPQVRESFIRNRWRTLKIQSWRAAAADIPSRFSERFSRFSKILTWHNHTALRQIRFILSHDLPSDSLKWASCYQLTIQWHRSPNTCLYLHWESSLVRYSRKLGFLWKRNYEFPTVANREMTRNGNILSWAR